MNINSAKRDIVSDPYGYFPQRLADRSKYLDDLQAVVANHQNYTLSSLAVLQRTIIQELGNNTVERAKRISSTASYRFHLWSEKHPKWAVVIKIITLGISVLVARSGKRKFDSIAYVVEVSHAVTTLQNHIQQRTASLERLENSALSRFVRGDFSFEEVYRVIDEVESEENVLRDKFCFQVRDYLKKFIISPETYILDESYKFLEALFVRLRCNKELEELQSDKGVYNDIGRWRELSEDSQQEHIIRMLNRRATFEPLIQGISQEVIIDLKAENFQKLTYDKQGQVIGIAQLLGSVDHKVEIALESLKKYLLSRAQKSEQTKELLELFDVKGSPAFRKGRFLQRQIRALEAENAPGWQERAVTLIRQSREDDLKKELERLRGASAFKDHEFVKIEAAVAQANVINYNGKGPSLRAQAKVQYAQMHEIKRIYEKTHHIFIHAQTISWTLFPQLIKELTRHFTPEKLRHHYKYLRTELDSGQNLTALEYQAEARKKASDYHFDDDLEVRKRLISVDGYLYNNNSAESALDYLINNKNDIDRNFPQRLKEQLKEALRKFKKHAPYNVVEALANRMIQAAASTKGLVTTGNLYVFVVPKEESAKVQYLAHAYGLPCSCRKVQEYARVLDTHQKGILDATSRCQVDSGQQYRIYHPALEKTEDAKIFRLNGLSRAHRTTIKSVVKQVAAELFAA